MSMLALAAAIAASALTAPLEKVYNDVPVVTNVTFDGLATTAQVDAAKAGATRAANAYADGATNRVATALRDEIEAAKPDLAPYAKTTDLAKVATSGAYADLTGKPTIPIVPTVVSAFQNDAGYVTKAVTNGLASAASVSAHTSAKNNPHGVTAAQVGAYTKKEADTKMSAASNALARAVAEIDGRTTNYVTRAEVTPEYNEDGTPTGAAARAAYAGEAYRSTNTDSAYESVLLCAVFNSYGVENEYRKIKYDLEAKAWSVWDRDVSSVRVNGVRSLLKPDGSPFATSNMVAGALAPYAKTADLPTVPAKVSALQNDAGYVTQSVTNGLASAASLAAKQDRPAAPIAATALAYRPDGAALSVTVAASASLAAELAGWTEGQAQTALVTLAAGASVDPGVRLVGYGSWPTNRFLASCVRVGTLVYVTPVTLIAE